MSTKMMLPDDMAKRRGAEVEKVNAYFARLEASSAHIERVYVRKRALAKQIMDGERLPDEHPFVQEAALRGLPQEEFARDVIYKPDVSTASDEREFARQQLLLKIKATKTRGELAELMHEFAFLNDQTIT